MLAYSPEQKRELKAFLFLTVFLAPIVAVGLVAGRGFVVWIFQMFAGPPGHPDALAGREFDCPLPCGRSAVG
ncbi:MAG: periplasmic nitrate reductase, NapE protein [Ahniella sp.]|nr:periplasmic nitrate reductase, NapE protein [Ahniella sp.]